MLFTKLNGVLRKIYKTPQRHIFTPTTNIAAYLTKYKDFPSSKTENMSRERLGGRITGIRRISSKLHFLDLSSNGVKVQIVLNGSQFENKELFNSIKEDIKRGYIVGVEGLPFRTKAGELSILASDLDILGRTDQNFPMLNWEHRDAITNYDLRFQKRFLDFLVNPRNMQYFHVRARVIDVIRNFLKDRGYLEVETPILASKAGGALATPFVTHSSYLKKDLELRIAPELYLKELIVGGFERVFELGKVFRNEGISQTHNPEFTMLEFYTAYSDYKELMTLVEELLLHLVKEIHNDHKFTLSDENKDIEISFKDKYKRLEVIPELEEFFKTKIYATNGELERELRILSKENDIYFPGLNLGEMSSKQVLEKLIEQIIEVKCRQPTYILHHPSSISPLAKRISSNSYLTERFELFINGIEVANGYSENADPHVQRENFLAQRGELSENENHFLEVLSYGMPPTAGCGIGVDRLTMLLTNNTNIKEIIFFPTTRIT